MTDPESVQAAQEEIGPTGVLPDDQVGVYYLIKVTDVAGNRVPSIVAEPEVRSTIFGIAVKTDAVLARKYAYQRYLLP
jgi:hypothetical protein